MCAVISLCAVIIFPVAAQGSATWGVNLCQMWYLSVFADPLIMLNGQYPSPTQQGCPTQFISTQTVQNSYDSGEQKGTEASAEIKVSGDASMGTLTANLLGNATGPNNAGVDGSDFSKWVDTFTINSPTLASGTLTTLDITFSYSGKIVGQLSANPQVIMEFISGDGASINPSNLSDVTLTSLGGASISLPGTLQVHVGHTFQLGAQMNAQVSASEGSASALTTIGGDPNTSQPEFQFTINIDPHDPCVSYTTVSGRNYLSKPPSKCLLPVPVKFSSSWTGRGATQRRFV